MKRVAFQAACALATLTAAVALWRLGHAVLLLVIAVTLASSANAGILALGRRGVPRRLAAALVLLPGSMLAATAISLSLTAAARELSQAGDELQRGYSQLRTLLAAQGRLSRELFERLPDPTHLLDGSALGQLSRGALGLTQNAFSAGAEVGIVLVMSLLWTVSAQPFERLWLSLMPATRRSRLHRDWQLLRDGVGLEVCSQLGQSLLLASLCGLAFTGLGLAYPVLAALAIGVLRLIPLLGPLLALMMALACGGSRGLLFSGAASMITLFALWGLRLVVAERLLGTRRVHPLLLGVVLISLWEAGGIGALLVCAPLATAIDIVVDQMMAPVAAPAPGRRLEDLANRYAQLERLVRLSPVERPRLQALIDRLGVLIVEAAIQKAARKNTSARQ